MDIYQAIAKAGQILDEERAAPSVSYKWDVKHAPAIIKALATITEPGRLQQIRAHRPRQVFEDPREFTFESTNYTLLCALLSQLHESQRSSLFTSVLIRIHSAPACCRNEGLVEPSWNRLVSELPLVAEFCVRNGSAANFCQFLAVTADPLPGHTVLLRHLEDMVALNFTVFTEPEYEQLANAVSSFGEIAKRKLEEYEGRKVSDVHWPKLGIVNVQSLCREIIAAAAAIQEQCRKARYLYLRRSLLEGFNPEIDQDKKEVENYLTKFGLSRALAECLNEADRLYRERRTRFDLKSSMGHLRSFLENMHAEALAAVHHKAGGDWPQGWGAGLAYLRQRGVLSQAEERFVAALYTLISDEAVHPLIAAHEYARLARNMVVEYALLFLRKLEKLELIPAVARKT